MLSDTEYNFLRSHPKLRVAVPDRQSLYAKAGPQGDFNGALRQVLDNLAHSLFLECEYLPESDAKSALDAVQNGQADLAAECLYDQNVARTRHVRLTPPYYIMNFVMLERRDSTVALSPRVACLNEFYVDTVLTGIYSPEQLRRYDSYAECLKAVASGQADLTFVPSIEVSSLLEQEQIFNLHIRNAAAFNYPVSLAIPESANPLLMSALCKAVNHLDPQQISPLLLDAAQVQEPRRKFSLRGFIYRHPVELLLALLATVVIVALLILLYLRLRGRSQRLQRQLRKRLQKQQKHPNWILKSGRARLPDVSAAGGSLCASCLRLP